jgi:trimeric autotransporter adhesin
MSHGSEQDAVPWRGAAQGPLFSSAGAGAAPSSRGTPPSPSPSPSPHPPPQRPRHAVVVHDDDDDDVDEFAWMDQVRAQSSSSYASDEDEDEDGDGEGEGAARSHDWRGEEDDGDGEEDGASRRRWPTDDDDNDVSEDEEPVQQPHRPPPAARRRRPAKRARAAGPPPSSSSATDDANERSRAAFLVANPALTGFSSLGSALLQTVRELCENALDAGAGRVHVSLAPAPTAASAAAAAAPAAAAAQSWEVQVEDDGKGMARSSLASLVGSVFASTKTGGGGGGGGAAAGVLTPPAPPPSSSAAAPSRPSFGRYGVGLKAVILHAQQSVQQQDEGPPPADDADLPLPLPLPLSRAPLYVATSTAADSHATTCRIGIDVSSDAVLLTDEVLVDKGEAVSASGTLVRVVVDGDASSMGVDGDGGSRRRKGRARKRGPQGGCGHELLAYFNRLALLPRPAALWVDVWGWTPPRGSTAAAGLVPAPRPQAPSTSSSAPPSLRTAAWGASAAAIAAGGGRDPASRVVNAVVEGAEAALAGLEAPAPAPAPRPPPPSSSSPSPAPSFSLRVPALDSIMHGGGTDGDAPSAFCAHLASAYAVPRSCVAHGRAGGGGGCEARVFVVLTPVQPPPSRTTPAPLAPSPDTVSSDLLTHAQRRNNTAGLVHVLRFANAVPLLASPSTCALTRGAVDAVDWAQVGLSLVPLAGGAGLTWLTARARAELIALPAAPAASGDGGDTVSVDAPGAYLAQSAVPDFPLVPFTCLRILIDVSGGGGAGAPLPFGDLTKTHVLDQASTVDVGGGDDDGGGRPPPPPCPTVSSTVAAAVAAALQALRASLPPGLLEPSDVLQRRLLTAVYLPSIAEHLAAVVRQAGPRSRAWADARATMLGVAAAWGADDEEGDDTSTFPERLRAFLLDKLSGTAGTALAIADAASAAATEAAAAAEGTAPASAAAPFGAAPVAAASGPPPEDSEDDGFAAAESAYASQRNAELVERRRLEARGRAAAARQSRGPPAVPPAAPVATAAPVDDEWAWAESGARGSSAAAPVVDDDDEGWGPTQEVVGAAAATTATAWGTGWPAARLEGMREWGGSCGVSAPAATGESGWGGAGTAAAEEEEEAEDDGQGWPEEWR